DRTSRFPTASISLTRVRKFESNFIADYESNIILLNEDWQSSNTLANFTILAFLKFLISRKSKENTALRFMLLTKTWHPSAKVNYEL
ncbi:hypothetical protein L249_2795, partial [Ophiocordyceps polyrhachis-furcata BCC 54312]